MQYSKTCLRLNNENIYQYVFSIVYRVKFKLQFIDYDSEFIVGRHDRL